MNSLEKYLTESYPADRQDVAEIEDALNAAVRVFSGANGFSETSAWPYAIYQPPEAIAGAFSQNTTAMILNTLLRFRGHFSAIPGDPSSEIKKNVFAVPGAKKSCGTERLYVALGLLLQHVLPGEVLTVNSTTYGASDIFTLAWLAEISHANLTFAEGETDISELDKGRWKKLSDCVKTAITKKVQDWGTKRKDSLFNPPFAESEDHSFPVLRLVQAARRTDAINDYTSFYKYFESSLHEQLSFSSIPDSRFDPAELMFCLEGMLLCQPTGVDRTIVDRVLEVLTVAQNNSAFWRPVKPFLATAQGMVLFPVSVEIANSLMRCCVMVDGSRLHDTYGSKCINLLRRYWQWLRSRAVIGAGDSKHMGWHSEHVNQTKTIHLWETSQVMDFLMSYRNMLHQHIARTTLVLSRVKEESPPFEKWEDLEATYEPVRSMGDKLLAYANIGRDFIEGRDQGKDQNFSMLLYGPPGTGKTTVAKSIAAALNYRMVTVTVSDFLASGGAQVESRAKDIFTVLMAQPSCVVLFDEIDHFLLDRDSARYAKQDTLFQFMTPGMLTKIADLREAERVLFIVATNYEDRIDPAIKRTGRIDRKYLVLPPDAAKRLDLLGGLLEKYGIRTRAEFAAFDAPILQQLMDCSLFLGFSDLKAAVQVFAKDKNHDFALLAKSLEDRVRTISLEAYQSRFLSGENGLPALRETPMNEFLALVALRTELHHVPPVKGKKALQNAADVMTAATSAANFSVDDIAKCNTFDFGPERNSKVFELFAK